MKILKVYFIIHFIMLTNFQKASFLVIHYNKYILSIII